MATELARLAPYNSLCKYCKNLVKTLQYAEDTYEQEQIGHLACSAIPSLVFSIDKQTDRYFIGATTIDEALNLIDVETNISNCSSFLAGALLKITSVTYDSGTGDTTVNYSIKGATGTPQLDIFDVSNTTALATVASAGDGDASVIISGLAEASYYIYMQLQTGEISNIYPFKLYTPT